MTEENALLNLIDWSAPIPKDDAPYIPILSPKAGASHERAIIVCPHMVAVETHYIRNRTKPCIGAANGCEGCSYGIRKRWKGYLGCWLPTASRYVLGELTKNASMDLRPIVDDRTKSMRGMELIMWRIGSHKNAPVKARIDPVNPSRRAELPEEFDIRKALLRIWERNTDKNVEYETDAEGEIPL